MSQLPFEIGYASAMSEQEMMDLDNELTERDFWHQNEQIRQMTDRYIQHFWRGPHGTGWAHTNLSPPTTFPAPVGYVEESDGLTVHARQVSIHVPECLNEETARLLVDMQLREQIFGHYSPND